MPVDNLSGNATLLPLLRNFIYFYQTKWIGLKKFRYDNIFVAFARIIIFYKTLKLSGGVRAPRICA